MIATLYAGHITAPITLGGATRGVGVIRSADGAQASWIEQDPSTPAREALMQRTIQPDGTVLAAHAVPDNWVPTRADRYGDQILARLPPFGSNPVSLPLAARAAGNQALEYAPLPARNETSIAGASDGHTLAILTFQHHRARITIWHP